MRERKNSYANYAEERQIDFTKNWNFVVVVVVAKRSAGSKCPDGYF